MLALHLTKACKGHTHRHTGEKKQNKNAIRIVCECLLSISLCAHADLKADFFFLFVCLLFGYPDVYQANLRM